MCWGRVECDSAFQRCIHAPGLSSHDCAGRWPLGCGAPSGTGRPSPLTTYTTPTCTLPFPCTLILTDMQLAMSPHAACACLHGPCTPRVRSWSMHFKGAFLLTWDEQPWLCREVALRLGCPLGYWPPQHLCLRELSLECCPPLLTARVPLRPVVHAV